MSNDPNLLQEAKAALPIPILWKRLGVPGEPKVGNNHSPFRDDDKQESFSIYDSGRRAKDHGTGWEGDSYDFFQKWKEWDPKQAFKPFIELAGLGHRLANGNGAAPGDFDWDRLVDAVTPAHLNELAAWRGYSPEFCRWLKQQRIIGRKADRWCFPHQHNGQILSAHVRIDKRRWFFEPTLRDLGLKLRPLVIGNLEDCEKAIGAESQWDLLAMLDRTGLYTDQKVVGVATRGAENAKLLAGIIPGSARIILLPQNDKPGQKWLSEAVDQIGLPVKVLRTPDKFADLNEWTVKGPADLLVISAALRNAAIRDRADVEKTQEPPAGEVLDEHATETQLARLLESKLPPVRCVGEDWFVYQKGVWSKTSRSEFKPLSLSIQDQRTRKVRKADEVLRHVEFASQVSGKEFRSFHFQDNDEILLNCANCVLAVSALQVRTLPPSEHYMFTQQLAASYRPEATAPAFERALEFALPDPADIEFLRCFSGYVLMPGCRHEAALLCYGESETCKSTVSTGIEAVLGTDLVTKFSLAQISNPESKNLAKLAGSALNLSTELDAIEVGSENFKCLVSGESIDADRKFRDSISLLTGCKFWFNANHLPKFKAGTDAELRRLHFLRFGQKVEERDETLKDRIRTEADGVLIFMLDGLRTLLSRRKFPDAGARSRQTKDRFKIQNDPISAFIETECVLGQPHRIIKIQLYDAYAKFGEANGIPPYSQTNFYRELYARYTSLKPIRDRDGDVRTQKVTGIDLRGEELKL